MAQKKAKRGWLGGKTTLTICGNYGTRRGKSSTRNGSVKAHVHAGLDISVPVGTNIKAPFDGTLTGKFDKAGYGLYSVLTGTYGGNKIELRFAHLSSSIVGKRGSTSVSEGQSIGKTGGKAGDPNAGNSRGAHLHFEYRVNGVLTHPKYFFSDTLILRGGGTLSTEDVQMPMVGNKADESKDEVEEKMIEVSEADMALDDSMDAGIYEEGIEPEEKETKDGLVPGIWQIVKMVMDSDVAELMLYDTSVSLQTGPLIGFFNKVCQQPFVEFTADTFGDQFYFLIRRPPFDYEGMTKTLETEGITSAATEFDNPFLLKSEDIVSMNFTQDTQNVYSWYQLFPVYEMGAQDAQYMIPAVFFPEYAAIWGSRELTVRSQYRTFVGTGTHDSNANGEKNEHTDNEVRHAIHDLKYLIECNAYAPFTRSGSIKVRGNRKIKRGTFIEVETSSEITEIFYVESVQQSYGVSMNSVERSTTVNVSHGMVKSLIFNDGMVNVNSQNEPASYFNLIDFGDYDKQKKKLNFDNWREVISTWKVKVDVFRFFIQKMQFIIGR